jgi:hypothetical protein
VVLSELSPGNWSAKIPLTSGRGFGGVKIGHSLKTKGEKVSYFDVSGRYVFSKRDYYYREGPVRLIRLANHEGFTRIGINYGEKGEPSVADASVVCSDNLMEIRLRLDNAPAEAPVPPETPEETSEETREETSEESTEPVAFPAGVVPGETAGETAPDAPSDTAGEEAVDEGGVIPQAPAGNLPVAGETPETDHQSREETAGENSSSSEVPLINDPMAREVEGRDNPAAEEIPTDSPPPSEVPGTSGIPENNGATVFPPILLFDNPPAAPTGIGAGGTPAGARTGSDGTPSQAPPTISIEQSIPENLRERDLPLLPSEPGGAAAEVPAEAAEEEAAAVPAGADGEGSGEIERIKQEELSEVPEIQARNDGAGRKASAAAIDIGKTERLEIFAGPETKNRRIVRPVDSPRTRASVLSNGRGGLLSRPANERETTAVF